jgi:transmembrane sensor
MMRVPRWTLVAAVVAVVAAVVLVLALREGWSFRGSRIETQVGEVRDSTLPDGTVVTLGAKSQLDHDVRERKRRVKLLAGEAFFVVSEDAGRPFTVGIDDVSVTAVGGKFEVRRLAESVNIAVLEGGVEVSQPSAKPVHVQAGEGVAAVKQRKLEVSPVRINDIGAWREGRMVYENATLGDLAADAHRYGTARIIIETPQLARQRITSSFRAAQVEGVLQTLQVALPISIRRESNGDILVRARVGSVQ